MRNLKDFTIVNNESYYQGGGGVIARALSTVEAKEELELIHELSCGDNDVSLYRHLQR